MWNNLNTLLSSIVGALSAELINIFSTINQSAGAVNMHLPVQWQLCVMLQKLWLTPSKIHILCCIYIFFYFWYLGNQFNLPSQQAMSSDNSNSRSVTWMLFPEISGHFISTLICCEG